MSLCNLDVFGSGLRFPLLLLSLLVATDGFAQEPKSQGEFSSKNFVVYTDLPEVEAKEILVRLEATLGRVSSYWGRRPKQRIECYIAGDLENWRDEDFPHGFARTLIGGVGGGAYSEARTDKRSKNKVTVYASARLGLAEHEAVHAYCGQTFGSAGPDWYKEGMAEMAFQSRDGKLELTCDKKVIKYLRESKQRTVKEITDSGRMNEKLSLSLMKLLSRTQSETAQQKQESLRVWHLDHHKSVSTARESYRSCWALCHFLSHNPNYTKRFHQLGRCYLEPRRKDSQQPELFSKLLGSMQPEIDFEYQFFLDRIGVGYRVDLCRWDWKGEFRSLDPGQSRSVQIKAAQGYQPSGLSVNKGHKYSFVTSGSWRIAQDGGEIDADGNPQGGGRLMGAILSEYKLSKPFALGTRGSFKASADGRLYLRCHDLWTEIDDNDGSLDVQLEHGAVGASPSLNSGE